MGQKYDAFLEKVQEIHDIEKAGWLMAWDREVNMPPGGAVERTMQMATLSSLVHRMTTSDEMGGLLEDAATEVAQEGLAYESVPASLVRKLERDFQEKRQLPEAYVREEAEVSGAALVAWKKAREENDFEQFRPHLEKVVELGQRKAELYGYEDEKYDALLDKFERGVTTKEVRAIFETVKAAIGPMIAAISENLDAVDASILHQPFPVEKQKEFAPYIAKAVGYDFERGHLGTAVHPFASSFSRNDARITTRWYPKFLSPSIFGVIHESGHAMYEQGTGADLSRTPLARGTSMGIHESQSRLFENYVGRSRGFWNRHYAKLQETFPQQLGHVSIEQFYRAINKVQPSYIRVEADELTYNMHIILRFEIEQDFVNGDLKAADLPEAWNAKMESLLGVTPPNDSLGCLQDIHWTRPGFGYFPTYALGGYYAAQFMEAALAQDPQIREELADGRVDSLLAWLRKNIHAPGSKFDPPELVKQVTGETLNPQPFIAYAKQKFGDIYNL